MQKIVLRHGLLAGLAMTAMFLATVPFHDRIGFDRGMIVGYASMVAAFLLVYVGVRRYRDTVGDGTIGFWRALAVGALIALVGSLCYTLAWQVIYFGFMPDYLDGYQAYVLDGLRAEGATAAAIEAKRAELARFAAMYQNPAINAAFTILEPLPVGLVVALVSAGILRRTASAPAAAGAPVDPAVDAHVAPLARG